MLSKIGSIKLQAKLSCFDTSTKQRFTGLSTPCPTLFALPLSFFKPLTPFFNDTNVSKNNWPPLSPQSIRHREEELTQFRSLGFQTANKTAVTRAPLAGCNAFQTHRKEAVRVSLGLEWCGTVTAACSPPVSQGQRLPHSQWLYYVCVFFTVKEGNVTYN